MFERNYLQIAYKSRNTEDSMDREPVVNLKHTPNIVGT